MISLSVVHYSVHDIRTTIIPWLEENTSGNYVYGWPRRYFTFDNESDATAFMLRFGAKRYKTTIEQMIEREQ